MVRFLHFCNTKKIGEILHLDTKNRIFWTRWVASLQVHHHFSSLQRGARLSSNYKKSIFKAPLRYLRVSLPQMAQEAALREVNQKWWIFFFFFLPTKPSLIIHRAFMSFLHLQLLNVRRILVWFPFACNYSFALEINPRFAWCSSSSFEPRGTSETDHCFEWR